jgi:hypothetical protein
MRRVGLLLLFCLAVLDARGATRAEEWKADIDSLATQLEKTHPRYKQCGLPAELRQRFKALQKTAGSRTDSQIAVEIQQALASVGDGHTLLWPFGMKRGVLLRIPLTLWLFDDGMYVVQSAQPEFIRRRVTRIGTLSIEEVTKRLERYISHDNAMQLRWAIPFYASVSDFLLAIGATDARDHVTLSFDDGTSATFAASPIDPATIDIKLPPQPGGPAYLLRRSENFYATTLADGTRYVQVNALEDTPGKSLADFGKELRSHLADRGRLILDLRLNSGGEARTANELLKTLIAFGVAGGRIAVLIDRMTFSAAQTLATRIDEWTDATFVGEPTGSRPNHAGNERPFRLPNSGLRGTIASGLNQPITANDTRTTIEPEIPVHVTAADYFSGQDPALKAALEALSNRR